MTDMPDPVMADLARFDREQQAEQDAERARDIVIDDVYSMTVEHLLKKLQRNAHESAEIAQKEKEFAYLITDIVDMFVGQVNNDD